MMSWNFRADWTNIDENVGFCVITVIWFRTTCPKGADKIARKLMVGYKTLSYIDTSILLENTPLVKFIRSYMRDSSVVLFKFVDVWSKHLQVFLEVLSNLRKCSKIFEKCSASFLWPSDKFWRIFGNLRKLVGNLRKVVKNAVIRMSI